MLQLLKKRGAAIRNGDIGQVRDIEASINLYKMDQY